jgi:hypothetical protein
MAYEISQFDLTDRQLLTGSARPATRMCTEIGNAQITQSIFGKARVRIICAHDRIRRVRILSALLAITIAIAIWQLTEYGEKLFGTPAAESVNATVQVGAPAFMPEYIPPSAASQRQDNLRTPTPAEIYQLTTRRPAPPPPIQNPVNAATNPATGQPAGAAISPTVPLASPLASPLGSATAKVPAATAPAPKPAVVQPAAPVVTTNPSAQPVAGKPAPVAPPQDKEAAATKPLAAPIQPAAPAVTQPE